MKKNGGQKSHETVSLKSCLIGMDQRWHLIPMFFSIYTIKAADWAKYSLPI
jgi:hypothetical protein